MYCTDLKELVEKFGIFYKHEEWKILIYLDEVVLLHNSNKYASILVGHFVILKESYTNFVVLLGTINYKDYN